MDERAGDRSTVSQKVRGRLAGGTSLCDVVGLFEDDMIKGCIEGGNGDKGKVVGGGGGMLSEWKYRVVEGCITYS